MSIDDLRRTADQHRQDRLDRTCNPCNHQIAEALGRNGHETRVWPGLGTDGDRARRLDETLRDKGDEVDGAIQVRQDDVIDILLPTRA